MCGVENLVGVVGRVYVGVGAWVRRIEYDVVLTSRSVFHTKQVRYDDNNYHEQINK